MGGTGARGGPVSAGPISPRIADLPRPVALTLSGGGAQGAAQAGAAAELLSAGLVPDLIIGTSVGAWNGAYIANDPTPAAVDVLLDHWRHRRVRRLFTGVGRGYLGALLLGRHAALTGKRLRRVIYDACGVLNFADLRVPCAVAAIDMLTAELVYIDDGPVSTAVLAASAIPTLLPPVEIGGRLFADAGFVDNFGVAEAVRRGARSVVLIDASVGTFGPAPMRLMQMFDRTTLVTRVHQRNAALRVAEEAGVEVHTLEVAGNGWVLDFAGAAANIGSGREVARRWCEGAILELPQRRSSPAPSHTRRPGTSSSRARISATASPLLSTSRNRRPSSFAATPVVPLPAHQSSTNAS
jgi:predicted acylesterase/phospholipase RssA